MKTKKNLSLRTAGMILGGLVLIVLAGCGGAGAGGSSDLTQEQAAQAAQTAFDALSLEDSDTDWISFDEPTVYFNNCVFEGITVNGQMTTVMSTDTLMMSSGNLTLAGPGLPSSPVTVSWNMVITTGDVVSITGGITVNGTTYSYDELGVTY